MSLPALSADPSSARPRLALVDFLRGCALVAMALYHVMWDSAFLGLIAYNITLDPVGIVIQRTILTSFMLLVGVGLVLGHGDGIRWRSFWRRFALVAGAALLVSAGTYGMAAATGINGFGVWFGVLHAIALFSLMGLAFLLLPLWAVLVVAIAMIGASALFSHPAFNAPWLAWIGFNPDLLPTADLVPVFPWFGVVVLGIVAGRLGQGWLRGAPGAFPTGGPLRALVVIGRWSLLFYVLHQPIIIGVLYPLSIFLPPPVANLPEPLVLPEPAVVDAFLTDCTAACEATGNGRGTCDQRCACALGVVVDRDLWTALATPGAEQSFAVSQVNTACEAVAEPPGFSPGG